MDKPEVNPVGEEPTETLQELLDRATSVELHTEMLQRGLEGLVTAIQEAYGRFAADKERGQGDELVHLHESAGDGIQKLLAMRDKIKHMVDEVEEIRTDTVSL